MFIIINFFLIPINLSFSFFFPSPFWFKTNKQIKKPPNLLLKCFFERQRSRSVPPPPAALGRGAGRGPGARDPPTLPAHREVKVAQPLRRAAPRAKILQNPPGREAQRSPQCFPGLKHVLRRLRASPSLSGCRAGTPLAPGCPDTSCFAGAVPVPARGEQQG